MSLENVKRFKEDVEKNEELKNKIMNEVVDILHIVEKVWLLMCHNCNYQNYNQIYIKDRYLYVL